jgi:excisionase family DNA binding protein
MSQITAEHLSRTACVYIRQSTSDQVHNNLESQRRQYSLVDRARSLGWPEVAVIDDDLGRSASGVHRPGFERLLALLCEGDVGAVLCVEASRLARNGRDWHTLLEFCRLVDALIIDEDGIYDARQANDRLLLGMKGTLSEMELSTLRQRSYEALMQKARRGELLTTVPIGYVRTRDDRIEIDPDLRIQEAIALVFGKFAEFGSIRQVLMWLRQERIEMPAVVYGPTGRSVQWRLPGYHGINKMLTNPIYAGAYAYGRTRTVTRVEKGRKRCLKGQRREQKDWEILIPAHHEGYIDWDQYTANQQQIAHNANMKGAMVRGAPRNGGALLAGLLRCGHCGRKLHVAYSGTEGQCLRYSCQGAKINHGTGQCISFGGLKADQQVCEELLRRLQPLGIHAALAAIDRRAELRSEQIRHKELAVEQARYEALRARRQYDAVDPDHRLVANELERRWNEALTKLAMCERELAWAQENQPNQLTESQREALLQLGDDLLTVWNHPASSSALKKRIVRTVIQEIVVGIEGELVTLTIHWQGGDHTRHQFAKNKTGHHRYRVGDDVVSLVQHLARVQPDQGIAAILNRLGLRSGRGHTWTDVRVRSFRNDHQIPVYVEGERVARGELTLQETATTLNVSTETVRRLIARKRLTAHQACVGAPWIIRAADVQRIAEELRVGASPRTADPKQGSLELQ